MTRTFSFFSLTSLPSLPSHPPVAFHGAVAMGTTSASVANVKRYLRQETFAISVHTTHSCGKQGVIKQIQHITFFLTLCDIVCLYLILSLLLLYHTIDITVIIFLFAIHNCTLLC